MGEELMFTAFLACSLALMNYFPDSTISTGYYAKLDNRYEDRLAVCLEIAQAAADNDVDPVLAISVAWVESGYRTDLVSSAGAVGPMQILPKWHCPDGKVEGCPLIRNGVLVLKKLVNKYGSAREALCHYNGGIKCGKHSRRYAKRVYQLSMSINRTMQSAIQGISATEPNCGKAYADHHYPDYGE